MAKGWKKLYSVGVDKIDEEHKQLFGLIEALEALEGKVDRDYQATVLNTLFEYSKSHFKHEEVLMKKINFPEYSSHKRLHEKFNHSIETLLRAFESEKQDLSAELLSFLTSWLQSHILVHDKKYHQFIKDNQIQTSHIKLT